MKQISKIVGCLSFLIAVLFVSSCTDNTDKLGLDMMPSSDTLRVFYDDYIVPTQTYEVEEPILARTSRSYLGQFTDPETGTCIKSDFLAQFHCIEDFAFPDSIIGDSIISTELLLYVDNFVGDSLATFKISVFPLTKVLDPDVDYYTNIDPERYCDTEA